MGKAFIIIGVLFLQFKFSQAQFDAMYHVKILNDLSGGTPGLVNYFQLLGNYKMSVVLGDGNSVSELKVSFPLNELSAIGCFKYKIIGILNFYAKPHKKFARSTYKIIDSVTKFSICVKDVNTANYIIGRFKKLYETISLAYPTENNPWFENDKARL